MKLKSESQLCAELGTAIKNRRHELGWRQSDIARRTKLGVATLGNIERGRYWPSMPALILICDALRCSPNQIVPQIPRAAPPPAVKTNVLRRAGIIDMRAMPKPVIAPEFS